MSSPQDLSHRSPAVGPRSCWPNAAIDAPLRTKSGLSLFRVTALFFWRVQGLRYNLLPLLCEVFFTSVCFSGADGEAILERRNTGAASFMPLMSLYLSQSSYSIRRQTLYFQEQKNEKALFSTAGAVIPCCQSPLYCRSCICSFLDSSIEGVVAAGVVTGTIMLLLKPVKKILPLHP